MNNIAQQDTQSFLLNRSTRGRGEGSRNSEAVIRPNWSRQPQASKAQEAKEDEPATAAAFSPWYVDIVSDETDCKMNMDSLQWRLVTFASGGAGAKNKTVKKCKHGRTSDLHRVTNVCRGTKGLSNSGLKELCVQHINSSQANRKADKESGPNAVVLL